ncbi:efflux RND transporter permease subunit [Sulfurimonas autotrophica]|uniref:RND efflux transporter n=1 Tax=Sulfurimonas autotrophica (strain ATCC BAA-671 / DSM 16294 / JCM 11897 / OK10) TaxID=563040 RepID=E0URN3_SULAO|nr:MMPL family transporter [Sulfurimonas autotrophica]ADN08977.1 RND efflux transporter [Sulfurimonas autotrophica DSM 16294]
MKKFVDLLIKFRWYIVIVIPLITIVLSYQLKYAQFDGSYRIWFGKDSKTLQQYDAFKNTFGNDDSIIIVFRDNNGIFNKKALHVIERLTEKLWQTKYIARVDSLTNYQYVHKNPQDADDILIDNFIEDIDALHVKDLQKKKKIALREDLIVNRIISKDAKTTMIVGRLTPKAGNTFGASKHIMHDINKYIKEEQKSGYKFYLAGGPVVNTTFSSLGQYDVKTFTPLVILIAMVMLWVIFRKISGVLLTILVVIFTFSIVLALQTIFGYKLNNFTANMPVFIIAIGIADAMHLFWIYLLGRKAGLDNYAAIHDTIEKNLVPTFLTSLTTAVGFASLGISDIVPIKTLGLATANAAILAFILTILFIPAALAILNIKVKVSKKPTSQQGLGDFAKKYAKFIIKNDNKIILATLVLFCFIAFGLTNLKVDSNAVRYFREDVPFRQTVNVIQKNLTGPMSYEIVIDSKKTDGIKNALFMKTVDKFSKEFKAKFPDARHTSSLVDVVKKFNEVIDANKSIPDNNNLIAQYLLLYSLSLPQGMEINDKMDVDERLLRLTASMNVVDTSKDLQMIEWIEEWWKKTPYSAQVNGQTQMFAHMQADVTDTLIESILLAIVVTSLLMFFIFKKLRMIPLFLIPNILPIILVIGVMGWLGINIDLGVAISGAIILGIAIDDTIHFLVKYKEARKKGFNFENSLAYVMQYAGLAMVLTTLVLSTAFIVFRLSQFMLNANFGLITAIALIIALLVDLLLLPALLGKLDAQDKSFLE